MTRCRIAGLTALSGSGYSAICHTGPIQIGPDVVGDVMWSGAYRIIWGHNTLLFAVNNEMDDHFDVIEETQQVSCACTVLMVYH
jgi:hypothetical protein